MEDDLTCAVCLDIFNDPHILTCNHNVCLSCAHKLSSSTNNDDNNEENNDDDNNNKNIVVCPLCRTPSTIDQLKCNISLRNIINVLEGKEATAPPIFVQDSVPNSSLRQFTAYWYYYAATGSAVQYKCDRCEARATLECPSCCKPDLLPLCADCSAILHNSGRMSEHDVAPVGSGKKEVVLRCKTHNKKMQMYCEEDQQVLCAHCVFVGHKNHSVLLLDEALAKLRPLSKTLLKHATANKKMLKEAVNKLDNAMFDTQQKKVHATESLEKSFTKLTTVLEKKHNALNEKVGKLFNKAEEELVQERSSLLAQISQINESQLSLRDLSMLSKSRAVDVLSKLAKRGKMDKYRAEKQCYVNLKVDITEILALLEKIDCTMFLGEFGDGSSGDLVIRNHVTLDVSKKIHNFNNLTIVAGGVLSCDEALVIFVKQRLLIEKGGAIDLNGKGYAGGLPKNNEANGFAQQGSSPHGAGKEAKENNGGGGGGGEGNANFGSTGGGGGGYGSAGVSAGPNKFTTPPNYAGIGGEEYGDAELTTLHLGSGGGAGHPYNPGTAGKGGNGGGAFSVKARILENYGLISANGENGGDGTLYGSGGGGGSGGSIHLHVHNFVNKGAVYALGGKGGITKQAKQQNSTSEGGDGGVGRIRLDISGDDVVIGTFVPAPHVVKESNEQNEEI